MAKLNKQLHMDYLRNYLVQNKVDPQEFLELVTGGYRHGNYRYSMVLEQLAKKTTRAEVKEWADGYIKAFFVGGKLNGKGKAVINNYRSMFGVKERL